MAADSVLFIGWTAPKTGRESIALEVFGQAVAFWTKQQQKGEIEGFDPVLLRPHGGDLGGFFLVRGDRVKLEAIERTDDWRNLQSQSTMIAEGFGVIGGYIGQGVQAELKRWAQYIPPK
jgi:hypothetical protein